MVINKRKKYTRKIAFYVTLVLLMLVTLFPFIMMLSTSFKITKEAISLHPTIWPHHWTLKHYAAIFNPHIFPYLMYFKNSMIVSIATSVISVAIGIFGAYALAKLHFKGREMINDSFYTVYMFSGILLIVPLFKIISGLGLYDTRTSLIIIMVVQTLPTTIFMLSSYFQTVPDDLSEAGMIDGLSRLQIIFYIIIPLSIPGILSVFVYCFMIAWNDYLFASIFFSNSANFTLPLGLYTLFSTPDYIWGRMMAASLVTAIPVVLLYALSDRFIKGNLTAGSVKG